jgi:WD40 repeat protein
MDDPLLEHWDVAAQKPTWERTRSQWPAIEFSADGELVATVNDSSRVLVREARTGKVVVAFTHGINAKGINAVRFSHDGERLYCAGKEGMIHVDGVKTRTDRSDSELLPGGERAEFPLGETLNKWPGHSGEVMVLALSPDEKHLVSGDDDGMLILRNLPLGRELARWQAHAVEITALTFSPDNNMLVSAASDGTIRLWDLPEIARELRQIGIGWDATIGGQTGAKTIMERNGNRDESHPESPR